jgi:tyrosyl-tRNA synthetase
MKINTDISRINEILERGTVVEAFPSIDELKKRLTSGERIRVYIGFDPTFTALHLGHAKNLIFLEELRQLGHEVIVLFGDFTARIGDPDKKTARKQLTEEEVQKNVSGWIKQVEPIIDFKDKENPAIIKYNSEWLSKLNFADIVGLASNFTVQQMLERDMFDKRYKGNVPIYFHEFMYPLMQGYDSVAMDVDAELCGQDQIFNALAGRTLMKRYKDKDKLVIALNMIANPATGELMSKSNGTGVFIDSSPSQLFGSIMSLPDPMLEPLFVNLTRIDMSKKEEIMSMGPRKAKAFIAKDIVARFHGIKEADLAEEQFENTFSKGGVPDDIDIVELKKGENLVDKLVKQQIVSSKTEWKRLVEANGVRDINENKITAMNYSPESDVILKIGKRRFVKVILG